MVIISGEQCSLISCCGQQESHKYIPEDIWHEIVSRLPIKPLFISGCVCKSWRNIFFAHGNKIDSNDPMYVPVCGLFLICLAGKRKESFKYICLRTKTCFSTHIDTSENNLYYSSGFERGLLTDLSFDFSILYNFTNLARNQRFVTFSLSRGLILVSLNVGRWEVHNPATKQIYVVPCSPTTAKYRFKCHRPAETPGHVIKLPSCLTEQRSGFIFVIFCIKLRIIEVYYSITRMWRKYDMTLAAEIMTPESYCYAFHGVVCNESGVLWLYVLTNTSFGVALKFEGSMNSELSQYFFPLPEVVATGSLVTETIWQCENSLYLTCFDCTGLWAWKAGCTQIDAWEWVPIIEINPARQWCKPVAREHLSKVVLDATARVCVLSLDPDVAVMYLRVRTSIFAYNFNTDTLDFIVGVEDDGDGTNYNYMAVPFKPLLNFFHAGQELLSNGFECR